MEQLFEIDLKDYNDGDSIFSRPSARGVIVKDNQIALVYSKKDKYFKFPGGGLKEDEDKKKALIREVREEVGLLVIPESIKEFGSVMRRQKSNKYEDTIFEQENYYYFCNVSDEAVEQNLDDYEKDAEFELKWVELDEAIRVNNEFISFDLFDEIMVIRENKVLQAIKNWLKRE